ncbi:uncharacterized protein DUF5123 [Breznakibacter xylanolyticus]|uniref:Uncharacterized protein DUF5123 n=2 Tax=Breznakibacter xylanolyticus TaxID=990 RepID=A0A2W7N5X8_9BACT|nr:uncharacterized protein DUF5123 [Breznakibacter xylanolyticus]
MFMKYNILKNIALCLAVSSVLFTGCKDDDELGDAPRLFRPYGVLSATTQNLRPLINVDLEAPISGAEKYEMTLFKADSVVNGTVYYDSSKVVDQGTTTETTFTFGNEKFLTWDVNYTVLVKAVGASIESKYFTCAAVTSTDYPTSLKNIVASELIDTAVVVRWEDGDEKYSFIDLTDAKDSILQRFDISGVSDNKLAIVDKLKPSTSYKVKAYVGTMPTQPVEGEAFAAVPDADYRGKKVFKTLARQEYKVFTDLRNLTDEVAYTYLTTDFVASLPDSSVVILKGGVTYKISGLTFTANDIKFVTGYSLDGQAKLEMSSNFKLTPAATTKGIEFENIHFYTPGVDETTANYGGKYLFNIGSAEADAVLKHLTFKACTFKFFRGVCRIQAAATIEKFSASNCIFTYIAGFGIANADNAAAVIGEMSLINSTVSYADKVFVNTKNPTKTTKVTVEKCTFTNSPISDGKSYMFDFNGSSADFKFSKCIFAKSRDAVNGSICFRASKSADFSSCYKSSDFVWYYAVDATAPTGALDGVLLYSKDWTELFKAPADFDFTLKDEKFDGYKIAGDPRWW